MKQRKSSLPWLLSFGQKEFGQVNAVTSKKSAWMRQIREVQTWKQFRGPVEAVMCETRDLGKKWPHWHTLIFSDEIKIDMMFVCPKDVLKRCWCRGPDQCTGRSGQQSMSMKR